MRKRVLMGMLLAAGSVSAWGQGIELHRVFGMGLFPKAGRPEWTVSAEQMGVVKWGMVRGRTDLHIGKQGLTGGYGEFIVEWRTKVNGVSVHTEYDVGIHRGEAYGEAGLAGVGYRWDSPNFSQGFSIACLYRYILHNKAHHNYQLSGTWQYGTGRLIEFQGFAKAWREYLVGEGGGEYQVWSEPQLWLNLGSLRESFFYESNFSIGAEVSIRYSIGIPTSFYAIPSAAMRLTF